jgi:hypothetical protein
MNLLVIAGALLEAMLSGPRELRVDQKTGETTEINVIGFAD